MRNLLIMDSGMGGLALLRKLYYSTPSNFTYFADTQNFPYGNKQRTDLQYIAEKNLLTLAEKYSFDTVIVACNTLTLATLAYLKQIFPQYTFVGCEPPVKQALQYTVSTPLLVATEFTVNKFCVGSDFWQIQRVALPNLATMVEQNAPDKEITQYIEVCLGGVSNFDSIVLGCTHYSLVKHNFQQLFPAVKIFDSIDGVYSRVKKLCGKRKNNADSTLTLEFSADRMSNEMKYGKMLDKLFGH